MLVPVLVLVLLLLLLPLAKGGRRVESSAAKLESMTSTWMWYCSALMRNAMRCRKSNMRRSNMLRASPAWAVKKRGGEIIIMGGDHHHGVGVIMAWA